MRWKIATAKQRFSEMIRCAEAEPQIIMCRERAVAAVIPVAELEAFSTWRKERGRSLMAAVEEAGRIAEEEAFELSVPDREDRPNPIPREAARATRRHERRR